MDNFDNNDSSVPDSNQTEGQQPEQELNYSDKLVGIITEPAATFASMSKHPPKTMDWFIPMIIFILFIFISQILLLSNKEIYYQVKEKQLARMEKTMNEMVQQGKMTKEQMNTQLNNIQNRMDKGLTPVQIIFQGIGTLIFVFIVFFIISAIYFLFAKAVFKDDGTYQSALVASGMVAYIGIIQIILVTIFAFLMGRMMNDFSVASFMDMDKTTIGGFLLAKVDIFSIWSYSVLSIGLAKLFKAASMVKYFALVFGVWIIGGLLLFFLAEAIPVLKFFGI